ncbi:MAG: hypothetical protein B0D91_08290 [Oceanospirillales bacterium LUC14_002_19_P2]|nr:MAG: hypothetical protein B0D91_08290 [Oceanospirillales bacterium LUC14_002_19_P2]
MIGSLFKRKPSNQQRKASEKRGRERARKQAVTTWREAAVVSDGRNREGKHRQKAPAHQSSHQAPPKPVARERGDGAGLRRFFILQKRVAGEAFSRLMATPLASLMTILVLGISLSLPTLLYVSLSNIETLAGGWQGVARLSLFLKLDASEQQSRQLQQTLLKEPGVESVTYISAQQGLAEFEQQSGLAGLVRQLGKNPLPAVLEVTPELSLAPTQLIALQERLSRLPQVDVVRLDRDWVERVHAILNLGRQATWGLASILAVALLLAVGNTIRLLVTARMDEIRVIRLVGGTDGYIMLPFVYTGFWYGVLGAMMAWLLSGILFLMASGAVDDLLRLYQSDYRPGFLGRGDTLILVISGAAIATLGAFLTCRRQLLQDETGAEG